MTDIDTNTALNLLKFAAIFVSGILGVVGLLVDYKDKDGRITKWGRRALVGIIASSLIAIGTQGLEVYRQRKDAKAARVTEEREAYERRVSQAIDKVKEATRDLDDTFAQVRSTPSELPALAIRVRDLEDARKGLLPYGQRTEVAGLLIRATQGLGLGQERLAYGGKERGCRYFLSGDRLQSCQISIGPQMGRDVRDMNRPGVIRCTDIDDDKMWKAASDTLNALDVLVQRTNSNANVAQEVQKTIPAAARTVGYFYLCDYLRNGRVDALQRARKAWDLFASKTDRTTVLTIYKDMPEKIRVLRAIEALADPPHRSSLCSEECPSDMD